MKKYPYKKLETHPAWNILEQAIADLVDNDDIIEQTPREYIVGYILKVLKRNDILK